MWPIINSVASWELNKISFSTVKSGTPLHINCLSYSNTNSNFCLYIHNGLQAHMPTQFTAHRTIACIINKLISTKDQTYNILFRQSCIRVCVKIHNKYSSLLFVTYIRHPIVSWDEYCFVYFNNIIFLNVLFPIQ